MLTELERWPSEQSVWCLSVRVIVQIPACTPGECRSPPAFKAYGGQKQGNPGRGKGNLVPGLAWDLPQYIS